MEHSVLKIPRPVRRRLRKLTQRPSEQSRRAHVILLLRETGNCVASVARNTARAGRHDHDLYLALNDIDHTKTTARTPQTNGICERFHKTILQEFYQITFRKKLYASLDELQADLDVWITYYNNERTHQGKMCCGRTPMETLHDGKNLWNEKRIA